MKILQPLIAFAIVAISFFITNANITNANAIAEECYSSGIRVGYIQKFSQKDLVNKSWEGELVMEGTTIKGTGGTVRGGNVWKFSATDKSVAAQIEDAVMSGKSVALKYCELNPITNLKALKFNTDTNYIITKAVVK